MLVPVRYIDAPHVTYLKTHSGASHIPNNIPIGRWNLAGARFHQRPVLVSIIYYGSSDALKALKGKKPEFDFHHQLSKYLNIPSANKPQFTGTLAKLDAKKPPAFVIWVTEDGNKSQYDGFRAATDRRIGAPSLCVTMGKIQYNMDNPKDTPGKHFPGFVANNAMKVNTRLQGGVNQIVALQPFLPGVNLKDTMILGADVTHPGPRSTKGMRSIAALVATMDSACCIYRGEARPIRGRTEVRHVFVAWRLKKQANYKLGHPARVFWAHV